MSDAEQRAADVRAPNDRLRDANDFGVLKFTSGTTHSANVLPKDWHEKFVTIYATGPVHFAFSEHSDAEVDSSVTATAAGASAKVGGIVDTLPRAVRVPRPPTDGRVYFVRESAASETVYMELSSP